MVCLGVYLPGYELLVFDICECLLYTYFVCLLISVVCVLDLVCGFDGFRFDF